MLKTMKDFETFGTVLVQLAGVADAQDREAVLDITDPSEMPEISVIEKIADAMGKTFSKKSKEGDKTRWFHDNVTTYVDMLEQQDNQRQVAVEVPEPTENEAPAITAVRERLSTLAANIKNVGAIILDNYTRAKTSHAFMDLVPLLYEYLLAKQELIGDITVVTKVKNSKTPISMPDLRRFCFEQVGYATRLDKSDVKRIDPSAVIVFENTKKNQAFENTVGVACKAAVLQFDGLLTITKVVAEDGAITLEAPCNQIEPTIPNGKGGIIVNTNTHLFPIPQRYVGLLYNKHYRVDRALKTPTLDKAELKDITARVTEAVKAGSLKVADHIAIADMIANLPPTMITPLVRGNLKYCADTMIDTVVTLVPETVEKPVFDSLTMLANALDTFIEKCKQFGNQPKVAA